MEHELRAEYVGSDLVPSSALRSADDLGPAVVAIGNALHPTPLVDTTSPNVCTWHKQRSSFTARLNRAGTESVSLMTPPPLTTHAADRVSQCGRGAARPVAGLCLL